MGARLDSAQDSRCDACARRVTAVSECVVVVGLTELQTRNGFAARASRRRMTTTIPGSTSNTPAGGIHVRRVAAVQRQPDLRTGTLPDWIARYLWLERAIDPRTAQFCGLTYDGQGICLPIEDRVKRRNLRGYDPATGRVDAGGDAKMHWVSRGQHPEDPLPPYPSWRDLRQAELICEGEFDALCAIDHGFLAASGTAGAGTWTQDWTDALTGRCVTLLYDADEPGRKGARAAAESLTLGGCHVRIVSWPADRLAGFDVTDHFRLGGDAFELQAIIDAAVLYELPLPGRRLVVVA